MPSHFAPVVALAAAMFFRMVGVFVALPVVAPFARGLPGPDGAWAVGMAVGAYGITQAAMQIPVGALADRVGRKPALALALVVFIVGGIVCAFADHVSGLVAGRLLQGAGAAAAAVAAWVSDLAPPEQRPQAMAVFGGAIAAAFAVSLLVASPLAGLVGTDGVFVVAALAGAVSLGLILPLRSPPRPVGRAASLREALAGGTLKRCALGAFVLHYAMAALFLQTPLALSETIPLAAHWKVYAPAFGLSLLAAVPLLMSAGRRRRATTAIAAGLAAVGFAAAVLAGNDPWKIGGGLALFFGGLAALEAMLPAAAASGAPDGGRGTALGFLMTCEFLGVFCGGAVSGVLLDVAGEAGLATGGGILFLGWIVVLWRERKE